MNRNVVVDLMRFLGIALIILAHVEPPNIIFQARTFDVPMMVFVSNGLLLLRQESGEFSSLRNI